MITLVIFSFQVQAINDDTVGGLLKNCEVIDLANSNDAWSQGYCFGLFSASMEYLAIIEGNNSNSRFALPKELNVGQLIAVYVKWAKNNPEMWHMGSHFGVVESVIEYFPSSD